MCSCTDGYQHVNGTNQCEGAAYIHIFILFILYIDIDECSTINDCQQLCVNAEGSYTCSCSEGFSLSVNDQDCTGVCAC